MSLPPPGTTVNSFLGKSEPLPHLVQILEDTPLDRFEGNGTSPGRLTTRQMFSVGCIQHRNVALIADVESEAHSDKRT